MSIDYDKKYYIDDDNGENIYDIKNLDENDGVRDFIQSNFFVIDLTEIHDNMKDIRKEYLASGRYNYADGEYSYYYDLHSDCDYYNLEVLQDRIMNNDIILLNKWDDNYIRLFIEASKYGYCEIDDIPTTVKNTVNIKKEQIIPGA